MRYEWQVGLRYLTSTRSELAPSVITVLSVAAVAIGVTVLIFVLSVMGGFEGDLRDKIIGSKAHILIEGPSHGPVVDPDDVVALAMRHPDVIGASPFIESELMISSPTNYSGVVVRGIDPELVGTATELRTYVQDGEFDWLTDPDAALAYAREHGSYGALQDDLERLRLEREALEDNVRSLEDRLAAVAATVDGAGEGSARASAPRSAMPPLTPAGGTELPYERRAPSATGSAMPPLTPAGGTELPYELRDRTPRTDSAIPPLAGPGTGRPVPGLLIGTELRDTLNVEVGDVVDIVNPDGPVGPTGPIPTVRQFRIIGVFYSGLYEYDSRNAYTTLDTARWFLDVPEDEVTGIELRVRTMDRAGHVRVDLEEMLGADADVSDWMQLNSSLFSALLLEKVVMGLLLMIIVLVASFGIVCVLIMIVIQKAAEISILRSMGATKRGVLQLFVVQGASIGLIGTVIGAGVGLAVTWFLATYGFPLDPEVYYIDRVPVEIDPVEVVAVVGGALLISLLATLYPAMQAARLDPAEGLRLE